MTRDQDDIGVVVVDPSQQRDHRRLPAAAARCGGRRRDPRRRQRFATTARLRSCSATPRPTRACASSPIPTTPASRSPATRARAYWPNARRGLAGVRQPGLPGRSRIRCRDLRDARAAARSATRWSAPTWSTRTACAIAAARRRDPDFAGDACAIRTRRRSALTMAPDAHVAAAGRCRVRRADADAARPVRARRRIRPGYRLHAEDLDLCRRVRDAGAVVAVANDVRVVHVRGVSSRSRPLFVEWHKHRGLWRWFRKFEAPHARPGDARGGVRDDLGRFPFAALRACGVSDRCVVERL